MRRHRRNGPRRADADAPTGQPGLPEGEARLLGVSERDGVVVINLDSGVYEVAPESAPTGLPPVGEVLDGELHRAVALAAARKKAARALLDMLDRRLRPVAQLRRKLIEAGHPDAAVDEVLAIMEQRGLHSDRRFAEAWCRDCLLSKAVGPRYLEAKLREKGVAPGLAARAAAEAMAGTDEDELARRAAAARWRKLRRGGDARRDLAKVVRHLLGRGFAPGVAQRAARECEPQPDDEQDDDGWGGGP
jgi:SOS response regulatory protein OraA/RecX